MNVVNALFDQVLFCGLVGQIAVGVLFGTPAAGWLGDRVMEVVVQLGYLGLVVLVWEGELLDS